MHSNCDMYFQEKKKRRRRRKKTIIFMARERALGSMR